MDKKDYELVVRQYINTLSIIGILNSKPSQRTRGFDVKLTHEIYIQQYEQRLARYEISLKIKRT